MNLPINKIIQGDCLDVMKEINGDFIMITDPPYNQNYHYDKFADKLSDKKYIELLSILRRPSVVIHYPEETINILPKILGKVDEVVSWVYNSNTGKQHRLISWWGCKPNFSKIKQSYKNLDDKRIKKRIAEGKYGAKLYDWWEVNQVKNVSNEKFGHPCQIPTEIMKRIILLTTEENDLIIDPFVGSGTTCVASKQLNRKYIGIEISEKYCKIARERLRQEVLL